MGGVEAEGLRIFDIDVPGGPKGVLRVTIQKPEGPKATVGVEDCARVSRRVSAMDRFDDLIPDAVTLEVSSPGVERKLRTLEHYQGAVGELVRLKVFDPKSGDTLVLQGVIESEADSQITLDLGEGESTTFPYADVSDGRV